MGGGRGGKGCGAPTAPKRRTQKKTTPPADQACDALAASSSAGLPQAELFGLSGEYNQKLQTWLEAILSHDILKNAMQTSGLNIDALKNKLEGSSETVDDPIIIAAGAIPFFWMNPLATPTPGVMVNEDDVDRLRDNWGATRALHVVSPLEKLHAPIKQCFVEIQRKTMTDARAREWLKLFANCPVDVWRLSPADVSTHSFTLREGTKGEAFAASWTTLQKVQMVIRETWAVKNASSNKKGPSVSQMEEHFLLKVKLAQNSEELSASFIDAAMSVKDRILANKAVSNAVLRLDSLYKNNGGPTDAIYKFQVVMNRCKTEHNIEWFYNWAPDALRMGHIELSDCSGTKLNMWGCDLANMKLRCLDYFLNRWAHAAAFTPEEIAFCRKTFASHVSFRSAFTNYPGEQPNDNSFLFVDGEGKKRPKSFRMAVTLWEKIIYGSECDGSLRQAAKYNKTPEELLDNQSFEEEEQLKQEQQQAIAATETADEFIFAKRPTDNNQESEYFDYLKMADRIARSLTRVVVVFLMDGGKPGITKALLAPWKVGSILEKSEKKAPDDDEAVVVDDHDEDDEEAVRFVSRGITVYKDEASMKERKKLTRGVACVKQTSQLHICSTAPLQLPPRASKHYPSSGTNQGAIIGPVVLPLPSEEWQATFATKKCIYGKDYRIAVGGEVAGQGEGKKRENDDWEMVSMNAMPPKFFSELNRRYFASHAFDISPGPGACGEECIYEGIAYFCLAFTELHAE
ncbi:unnamed protein product, partial [Prorocentrum cordatum]